jgi:hypothetical protein
MPPATALGGRRADSTAVAWFPDHLLATHHAAILRVVVSTFYRLLSGFEVCECSFVLPCEIIDCVVHSCFEVLGVLFDCCIV